jgi:predicted metal-dependent TIM-barrel fold hydrolase
VTVDFPIIDAHAHLDFIVESNPDRTEWLKSHGVTVVSWAFCEGATTLAEVGRYMEAHASVVRDSAGRGLGAYHVVGIHPRCIPTEPFEDRDLRSFLEGLFQSFSDDPLCLGVGEIGLETGGEAERRVFRAQLEAVAPLERFRVCVHTPRKDKPRVTGEILELLDDSGLDPERVVVDHLTPETLGAVLQRGYRAGVTLSAIKCKPSDVFEMLEAHPPALHRLMLNTDSNGNFHEDEVRFLTDPQTPQAWKTHLGCANAARFFGISVAT